MIRLMQHLDLRKFGLILEKAICCKSLLLKLSLLTGGTAASFSIEPKGSNIKIGGGREEVTFRTG